MNIRISSNSIPKSEIRRVILALTCFFSTVLYAHQPQSGNLYLSTGGLVATTLHQASFHHKIQTYGFALRALGDVDENGSLEFSVFGFDKYYSIKTGQGKKTDRLRRLQVVSGYRHWFYPWFSFSGGLNSGYIMGDPKTLVDPCHIACPEEKTNAQTVTEYALDLELTWSPTLIDENELMVSTRYSYSFSSAPNRSSDTIMFLVELKVPWPKPKITKPDNR